MSNTRRKVKGLWLFAHVELPFHRDAFVAGRLAACLHQVNDAWQSTLGIVYLESELSQRCDREAAVLPCGHWRANEHLPIIGHHMLTSRALLIEELSLQPSH